MEMKSCSQCKIGKPYKEFYKESSSKDGLTSACKQCTSLNKLEYYRSKKGLVTKLYNNQKGSCKKRGDANPTYSKKELEQWLFSQEKFHVMYDNWKRLDFQKEYTPSVDRKDDYISYTLSNIQLMTWLENNNKGYKDRANGVNAKVSKKVAQYSIDGEFIAIHKSVKLASTSTGVDKTSIACACRGVYKQAGGFKWKYLNTMTEGEL